MRLELQSRDDYLSTKGLCSCPQSRVVGWKQLLCQGPCIHIQVGLCDRVLANGTQAEIIFITSDLAQKNLHL